MRQQFKNGQKTFLATNVPENLIHPNPEAIRMAGFGGGTGCERKPVLEALVSQALEKHSQRTGSVFSVGFVTTVLRLCDGTDQKLPNLEVFSRRGIDRDNETPISWGDTEYLARIFKRLLPEDQMPVRRDETIEQRLNNFAVLRGMVLES